MDWNNVGADAVTALVPVAGALITFFVKQLLPKIPRVAIPLIAMGLGVGLDALLAFISGGVWNPILGALLGGCAVWLREIINTFNEHGLSGSE